MTSKGFVTRPARPPASPAQIKYQNIEFYFSHGRKYVFKFSFTVTTVVANGIFMLTVTG